MTVWLPTLEAIDALPDGARLYIRALEADRDPEGMVRANALLRDQVDKLGDRLAQMHAAMVQVNELAMGALVG